MIDFQNLHPDWEKAQAHGKAVTPGHIPSDEHINSKTTLCPCCLNAIQKEPIPLCENVKQLEFLGFGFPLFYDFMVNCAIILLIFICSYTSMSFFWAIKNNASFCDGIPEAPSHIVNNATQNSISKIVSSDSSSKICSSFMVQFSRIQAQLSEQETVLRSVSFIIHMLALLYLRNKHRVLSEYYTQRSILISDYSLLIKGLPQVTGIKAKLAQFFKNQFSKQINIQQITLAPDIDQIELLSAKKNKLIKKKLNLEKKNNFEEDQEKVNELVAQIKKVKEQIKQKCTQVDEKIRKDDIVSKNVIVTLDSEASRILAMKEFKKIKRENLQSYFQGHSKNIELSKAPEPREIIWQNFYIAKKQRFIRVLIGTFGSLILIAIVTTIFYIINVQKSNWIAHYFHNYNQDPQERTEDRNKAISLVYIGLFCVIIFNKFGMSIILHKICHMEKHFNTSEQQLSFAIKYGFGMFFTTALMTLAIEALKFRNYYSHQYGVIEEETLMFFLNSLFVPLLWLINPIYIYKRLKRRIFYGSQYKTQQEANQLMEDPPYDLGKRYGQILQTMWFTFLYGSLIPFGSFLSILGLVLYYWVDKYNLLRRSALNGNVSRNLSLTAMKLLDLTLLFRSAGQIIFDFDLRQTTSEISIIFLITSILFLLIPWNIFLKHLTQQKFKLNERKFSQVRYRFTETYHTMHTIYKELYLINHIRRRNMTFGLILPSGRQIICSDVRLFRDDNIQK